MKGSEHQTNNGTGYPSAKLGGEGPRRINQSRCPSTIDVLRIIGRIAQHGKKQSRKNGRSKLGNNADDKNGQGISRSAKNQEGIHQTGEQKGIDKQALFTQPFGQPCRSHAVAMAPAMEASISATI